MNTGDPGQPGGAPCWLNERSDDPTWPGSPCLLELGLCLSCGRRDEFNWATMAHERYGLWAQKTRGGHQMEDDKCSDLDPTLARWRDHARQPHDPQVARLIRAAQNVLLADTQVVTGLHGLGELRSAWEAVTGQELSQ